jgi:hypothetical protein
MSTSRKKHTSQKGSEPAAPRKRPVLRRSIGAHRIRRSAPHWFFDPRVQAGIAEAEEDFAAGRFYTTDSPESAQRLLDSWK